MAFFFNTHNGLAHLAPLFFLMIIDQEPIIAKSGRFPTPQAARWSVG